MLHEDGGVSSELLHSPLPGLVPPETKVRCLMVTAPLIVITSSA